MTIEIDPNGIDQHAPGAKLDAGKPRPDLVLGGFARALMEVVQVGTCGAAKYTDNGWKEVPDAKRRYSDAQGRHVLKRQAGEHFDPDFGLLHRAHEAWNALAALEMEIKEREANGEPVRVTAGGITASTGLRGCTEHMLDLADLGERSVKEMYTHINGNLSR